MSKVQRKMVLLFLVGYPGVNLPETFVWSNSFVSYVIDSPWETVKEGLHFWALYHYNSRTADFDISSQWGTTLPNPPTEHTVNISQKKEWDINETKQLFGVYMRWKHVGMSRFQIRETCFVPFFLLDALSDASPVESRHSRLSLILKGTPCILCRLSQMDPVWL